MAYLYFTSSPVRWNCAWQKSKTDIVAWGPEQMVFFLSVKAENRLESVDYRITVQLLI